MAKVGSLAMLLLSICPVAEGQDLSLSRLKSVAEKYKRIGSYDVLATASHPFPPNLQMRWHLEMTYASRRFTPSSLPVPIIHVMRCGGFEVLDEKGTVTKPNLTSPAPGPYFDFGKVDLDIATSRIVKTESLEAGGRKVHCDVVEVLYMGHRRKPANVPIRYWIDQSTNTVLKMQFDEVDSLFENFTDQWTVVFGTWTTNKPVPAWAIRAASENGGVEQTGLVGKTAPLLTGRTLGGDPFDLRGHRGEIVVLDFWATWCGPCSEQMASLERLTASSVGTEIRVISITQDSPEAVGRWMLQHKHKLSVVLVRPEVFKDYSIASMPNIVVVDSQGRVAKQWAGLRREQDILAAVSALR